MVILTCLVMRCELFLSVDEWANRILIKRLSCMLHIHFVF